MTKTELFALYERSYVHEVEVRDKINSRLQTPMTIIVALIGVIAFLMQNYEIESFKMAADHVMFLFFLSVSAIALVLAVYYFIRSWWNNPYWFLPAPVETANYRRELEETYAGYDNADELVDRYSGEYVEQKYIEYASWNAKVNDNRSAYLHRCNAVIVLAVVMLFVAFLIFYFSGFDKTRVRKAQEVYIERPVPVRVVK